MFANFLCEKVLKTSTAKWADLKDENEFLRGSERAGAIACDVTALRTYFYDDNWAFGHVSRA